MKALILTNSENTLKWRSLTSKLKVIEGALNSGKNADFTVDIHAVSHTPMVVNHRIVHNWLNQMIAPFFKQGYDLLPFHMTMSQKKEFGIQASLRGANPRSDDEMGDMYFFADENTKRNGFNQYIETCLHEIVHEYFAETGLPDITHEWHAKHGTIVGLFATLDWSLYQPNRMKLKLIKNLLVKVVELITLKKNLTNTDLRPLVKRQADKIVEEMKLLGHEVRIVEGYRSNERQAELYTQGRPTGSIVTNAKAGESFHNYGVAVDFVFRREGYNASQELWETLGAIGKKHGFEWGGDWEKFTDRPHFQMTLGYSLKSFQQGKVDYRKFL